MRSSHAANVARDSVAVARIRHGVAGYIDASRRTFLRETGLGVGTLALAHLLQQDGLLNAVAPPRRSPGGADLRPRPGHFPAQAKAVIMLMQIGGPSQVDLFDPKPELQKRHG